MARRGPRGVSAPGGTEVRSARLSFWRSGGECARRRCLFRTTVCEERPHSRRRRLLDLLSFQLQTRLRVSALHAIDVTPPVSVGDLRDGEMWPYPDGYAAFKELSARGPDPVTRAVPLLPVDPPALSQANPIGASRYGWPLRRSPL